MESRPASRHLRETRVVRNLPLRRRCLYLMDPSFLDTCFGTVDAGARERAAATAHLLEAFLNDMPWRDAAGDELETAVRGMSQDVRCAVTAPSTAPAAAQPRRGKWAEWELGVEALLAILEHGTSTDDRAESGSTSGGRAPHHKPVRSAASLANDTPVTSSSHGDATAAEKRVEELLCRLVVELYECGKAFYAAQREERRQAASRRRPREGQGSPAENSLDRRGSNATADGSHFPMRVTWSVAAPVATSVQDLYRVE